MESTVSVSKGVFLFKNGFKHYKTKSSKKSKCLHEKLFTKEQWHETYKNNWAVIEHELKELHHKTYSLLLNDIVNYVNSYSGHEPIDGIIPSATLLTGVNQPDHVSQFDALVDKLREEVSPHIAMISSQDAPTLKQLVENVVWHFIHGDNALDTTEDEDSSSKKLRKNQCTMRALQKWYQSKIVAMPLNKKKLNAPKNSLIIIFPDFESFNSNVLQDFVMIASSYVSTLPMIFVFGVATSVSALHKSFPYHVSSKLLIKVFHSHASPVYMNQVLQEIFLTHTSPLHLSGKAFQLLTDVFLFYDFSVTGLVQSIKYCMMEHYYGDNIKSLCCKREDLEQSITKLSDQDLEDIRQLLSFRPYLESQDVQTQIKLFEDNEFFTKILRKEMFKLHDYLYTFYVCIRLLHVFTLDLPKNMLGKTIREIYTKCVANQITETQAFRECMQLLKFQSQVRLAETIKSALKVINSNLKQVSPVKPFRSTPTKNNLNNIRLNGKLGQNFIKTVREHLDMFLREIEKANTETRQLIKMSTDEDEDVENVAWNRLKMKENLLRATRTDRMQSQFELVRSHFTIYLEKLFSMGLQPPQTQAFHEILFFSDVAAVKKQIVGSPRGALHTALSNPVHYLQCTCCHLVGVESVSSCLPALSLAYKLHRECGRLINLYDWLQAFTAVLVPECDDDTTPQDEHVQAQFTRAVAELQFLGLIKSSKRKTDHVMRLTW